MTVPAGCVKFAHGCVRMLSTATKDPGCTCKHAVANQLIRSIVDEQGWPDQRTYG